MTAAHAAHEAHVRAALERLRLLGAGERQIAALKEAEQIDSNVTVPAPIDGVVLARMANLGLVVNKAQELFTVADLSTVWVILSRKAGDLGQISAAVRCEELIGKHRGMFIDRQVADVAISTEPSIVEILRGRRAKRLELVEKKAPLQAETFRDYLLDRNSDLGHTICSGGPQ